MIKLDIKTYIRNNLIEFSINKGLSPDDLKIIIECPKDEGHGDYSTNLAMILSKQLKSNPKNIAGEIKEYFNKIPGVSEYITKSEIAGPGFINFWVCDKYFMKETESIL